MYFSQEREDGALVKYGYLICCFMTHVRMCCLLQYVMLEQRGHNKATIQVYTQTDPNKYLRFVAIKYIFIKFMLICCYVNMLIYLMEFGTKVLSSQLYYRGGF